MGIRKRIKGIFESIFSDIEGKLKTLAGVLCLIGVVSFVIQLFSLIFMDKYYPDTTIFSFATLIGGFIVYAIAELLVQVKLENQQLKDLMQKLDKTEKDQQPSSWEMSSRANWNARKATNESQGTYPPECRTDYPPESDGDRPVECVSPPHECGSSMGKGTISQAFHKDEE